MSDVTSIDARTGESRGVVAQDTTTDELNAICAKAYGLAEPWRQTKRTERARVLRAIADAVDAAVDELVAVADAESALGEVRLRGEVGRTTGQLRFFAGVITDGGYLEATIDHADATLAVPRPDLRMWREPLGPVAVFGASNFPFAFSVLGGDTASALAAGCPVVAKAHPSHPATCLAVLERCRTGLIAAGADPDLVQLVHGLEAGAALVAHPVISAVGFTGSQGAGKALGRIAAERPVPVPFHGELGSVNPVVVTPAAAAERADKVGADLAGAVLLGAGQFCTKPGLCLVPAGAAGDAVVAAMAAAIRATAGFTLLDEGIAGRYREGVAEQAGQEKVSVAAEGPGEGRTVGARLFEVAAADLSGRVTEECFGPTSVVVRYDDVADVPDVLARLEPSLTTTLQHGDGEPVGELARTLAHQSGRVVFNGVPTGVAVTWAMTHGGPWPATTTPTTSVGAAAITRWLRPVTYQNAPAEALPDELRDGQVDLPRRINGELVVPERPSE